MATTAQLESVNLTITGLEEALQSGLVQSYELPNGTKVTRPHFAATLATLYAERSRLEQQLARQSRRPVRAWRRSNA